MSPFLREPRLLALLLLSTALTACGGGGDDDEDEDVVEDESAVGIWGGTYQLSGSPLRQFDLIAAPSGQFAGVISPTSVTSNDSRVVVGVGDTTGANLTVSSGTVFAAPGTTLPSGAATAPFSAFSGTVNEGVTMAGTWSAGGETGSYSLNYNQPITARGSSLAAVQGVYATTSGTATLTITGTGQLTFNTTACVGNGTIASTGAAVNVYSWSMTIAAVAGSTCTVAGTTTGGLAVLRDSNGAQNNTFVAIAALPTIPFYFVGRK
jgi:hypothetical protein